ncbi:MAG: UDP-3-O-(3-hydroxymyristoyl)glucosamine N-acyltransferase [Acidobacteria bacterium]|nr:UDP-3-O-(3-hydroxymyristoyl)glucosamine N-acyltransferase [Acidobacteriota bacterium]MBV9434468.1 UDP-3-O-(3-hydroxymyristoyl)glucosamine N-acyltransferase [Acidobacteriota bacterium]
MKLQELAHRLGGRLENASAPIDIVGVAGIEQAKPGQVTFVANSKYAASARSTSASAVIVGDDFPAIQRPLLRHGNPYLAFAQAIDIFHPQSRRSPGVHLTAIIHSSSKIGKRAVIGPYVVIEEDVEIGDDCTLLAHVVIYPGVRIGNNFFAHAHAAVRESCVLGDNVILQNGAVVGADGFGFAKDDKGEWRKISQSGPTVVENDVEIQANACIDRASVGETRIGRGTKVDNLVQVGHGSKVGERTLLCAQVGLAGSTHVGNDVILAGQVGVAGHCSIGNGVIATAQSGIPNDVPEGKVVSGYPAIDNRQWLRAVAIFSRLPELARNLRISRKGSTTQETIK